LFLLKGHESVGVKTIQGQILNNYFLPIFGIVPLIYGLIKEETIISKILSTKLFEKLGKSSYVFYIIHMGVIQKFISNYFHSHFILYFILLVVSWLVFKYVEEPLNIAIKKLTSQNQLKYKNIQ
jgi:peptidoglycan/LPS O-acetylase OafA/YrhL